MIDIYLIRHGETDKAKNRLQTKDISMNDDDASLNDRGEHQARKVALYFKDNNVLDLNKALFLHSNKERTRETAQYFCEVLDVSYLDYSKGYNSLREHYPLDFNLNSILSSDFDKVRYKDLFESLSYASYHYLSKGLLQRDILDDDELSERMLDPAEPLKPLAKDIALFQCSKLRELFKIDPSSARAYFNRKINDNNPFISNNIGWSYLSSLRGIIESHNVDQLVIFTHNSSRKCIYRALFQGDEENFRFPSKINKDFCGVQLLHYKNGGFWIDTPYVYNDSSLNPDSPNMD
jgi:broad specificity phosphatase PhoE